MVSVKKDKGYLQFKDMLILRSLFVYQIALIEEWLFSKVIENSEVLQNNKHFQKFGYIEPGASMGHDDFDFCFHYNAKIQRYDYSYSNLWGKHAVFALDNNGLIAREIKNFFEDEFLKFKDIRGVLAHDQANDFNYYSLIKDIEKMISICTLLGCEEHVRYALMLVNEINDKNLFAEASGSLEGI